MNTNTKQDIQPNQPVQNVDDMLSLREILDMVVGNWKWLCFRHSCVWP